MTARLPNIFVLCTGRCGSTTFAAACRHMTNYTVGHETRSGAFGLDRFAYPADHIEVDNRLAWHLGSLAESAVSVGAGYVHLMRDREATAKSFARRYREGIIGAYNSHILMGLRSDADPFEVCLDFVDTVRANIDLFLRTRRRVWTVRIEQPHEFARWWLDIGAQGDLSAALTELRTHHNASPC